MADWLGTDYSWFEVAGWPSVLVVAVAVGYYLLRMEPIDRSCW